MVARNLWMLVLLGVFSANYTRAQSSGSQQQPPPAKDASPSTAAPQQPPLAEEGNIPEEDETEHQDTVYHFNPIRAKKEFDTGVFYSRKGSHRAAAARFLEATRWNPNFTEAFLRLGEEQAKLNHKDDAKKALSKVIEIAPESKEAKEAKKLTAKL
jgi:tetratricopeptide (TPR) repeat protein